MQLNEQVRQYVFKQWLDQKITAYAARHGLNRNALTAFAKGENKTLMLSAAEPIIKDMIREGVSVDQWAQDDEKCP